ncbi:MAG: 7-carboxy-7-deazaguanine synthase QueE [Deltaproteobacteria bacterium]|jgi:organic radical activating enzyme|nr:7-carboxy-7-deazaguanine synthase QueE [Deltaproteobacteria bacterium]
MLAPATRKIEVPLVEVFSSLQGEGIMIGCRQIFVRFAGCNLTCDYCDTQFHEELIFNVETEPGSKQFMTLENPANLNELKHVILDWQCRCNNVHQSVSLTGGEPLLHADKLKVWLPEILPILPIYLETNGTLPDELRDILPLVSMISMDIKLHSTSGTDTAWDLHANFMALGAEKLCQVKLVVDASTTAEELIRAGKLVSQYAPGCPLILQPRTLASGLSLDGRSLLELQKIAGSAHHDIRVIPQIHHWLGVC